MKLTLTVNLLNRCRSVFLQCNEFNSDDSLNAVFVTDELRPFRDRLPIVADKAGRVDQCIAYLTEKHSSNGQSVLLLLLSTLRDRYNIGDALHDELGNCYREYERELRNHLKRDNKTEVTILTTLPSSKLAMQRVERKRKPAPRPPDRLIEQIAAKNVIPIIGAGLSISASLQGMGGIMPTYLELLHQLTEKAEKLGAEQPAIQIIKIALASGDTRTTASRLQEILQGDFSRELRSILKPLDENILPSPTHNLLRTLGFRHIITTNYDRLLEKFVAPNHEVITPHDVDSFQLFQDSLAESSLEKFILKLHGDITRPDTIMFGEDRLRELYENHGRTDLSQFFTKIFSGKTFLFLGFSFESPSEAYVKLAATYLRGSGRRHYALIPSIADKSWHIELTKTANIHFLEYEPDKDHSQVWEFVSFLNAGKRDDPFPGKKWAQWYLPEQRHHYLQRQLSIEKTARSIKFLTPTLTNAISTDDHLNYKCYPKYQNQPDVIQAMFARRDNLEKGLQNGHLEVRAMFLKEAVDKDFSTPDPVAAERYRHLISLLNDPKIDLEIRLIPNLTMDDLKQREAAYALIFSDTPKPDTDVAIAYATQATVDLFEIHMIEINTDTVRDRTFQFERFWASAWGEQQSKVYIESLLHKHNTPSE